MVMAHARRILTLAALLGGTAGCTAAPVAVPDSDEPFLYLVLNQRTPDRNTIDGRFAQHAVLLTTGSPAEPVRFRAAERFELRATGDPTLFGWRALPVRGEQGSYPSASLDRPNWILPDTTAAGSASAKDIRPGVRYALTVVTEGRTLRGETVVPDSFSIRTTQDGDRRVAVWPRVRGAAGYRIEFADEAPRVQSDTTFSFPSSARAGSLTVYAMDPNVYRYTVERRSEREGLDGGFGVFGSVSVARF
jgi:hypothetical protein